MPETSTQPQGPTIAEPPFEFLVEYSDRFHAQRAGGPKRGSIVRFNSFGEVLAWQALMGHAVIIHDAGWQASWAEYCYLGDQEEADDEYRVHPLPPGWETMRWIEVYNGIRG